MGEEQVSPARVELQAQLRTTRRSHGSACTLRSGEELETTRASVDNREIRRLSLDLKGMLGKGQREEMGQLHVISTNK